MSTTKLIKTVIPYKTIDKAGVFDEFTLIKNILKKNKRIKSLHTLDEKWTYVFKTSDIESNFPNLKIIVEFVKCIPASNANVERVFSNMNNLWTDEKSRMNVHTVKAMLVVKHYFYRKPY